MLTALLDVTDLLPSGFAVGESALRGLTTVKSSTFMSRSLPEPRECWRSRRTRARRSACHLRDDDPGVAYLGVAADVGEIGKTAGAAAVLCVNVVMLTVGGTATLLAQRALARRAAERVQPS